MARIRQTHPSLYSDDKVTQLTHGARFFYEGTVHFADDEGRLEWKPRQLAALIFSDIGALDATVGYMEEIKKVGLIYVYVCNGREYALHRNYKRYQYITKPVPSRLPAPEGYDQAAREPSAIIDRRPLISDREKRKAAVAYGCEPGESLSLTCGRCEVIGEIRWPRREGGRPGSTVGLFDLDWDVAQTVDAGTVSDVRICCETCLTVIPKPLAVAAGPLFAEVTSIVSDAAAPPVMCHSTQKVLVLETESEYLSKSVGGVGEQKVVSAIAAVAAPPPSDEKKTTRIKPQSPAPPVFSAELETEMAAFVALLASKNRDGAIAVGRIDATRREVARRVEKLGEPAVLHGLREAVRYDKPSIEYANACARKWVPDAQKPALSSRAPAVREVKIGTIRPEDRDGGWLRRLKAEKLAVDVASAPSVDRQAVVSGAA